MSRHEGVNCDACQKGNFKGKRYKCLVCFDYDLCASCYDSGAVNASHTVDHPMQCILTPLDHELYYGGELVTHPDHPYSYSCPFCKRMGFTIVTLEEHVVADHSDVGATEVICPVCAAHPGGEPNFTTADFIGHLTLEHNPEFRDLISFLDEPASGTAGGRSTAHSRVTPSGASRRGFTSARVRRSNMHFGVFNSAGAVSPATNRDFVDPIAELLTQLSGVRRSTTNTALGGHGPVNIEQLQMQMQLEREHYNAARLQMEHRFSRKKPQGHSSHANQNNNNLSLLNSGALAPSSGASTKISTKFLLDDAMKEAQALQKEDAEVLATRSAFLKNILISTLEKKVPESPKSKAKTGSDSKPKEFTVKPDVLPVVVPIVANQVRGRARSSFAKETGKKINKR